MRLKCGKIKSFSNAFQILLRKIKNPTLLKHLQSTAHVIIRRVFFSISGINFTKAVSVTAYSETEIIIC